MNILQPIRFVPYRAGLLSRKRIYVTGLLMLAGLACGCKTTFRTVNEQLITGQVSCRQVQILPVFFAGAGNIDRTLTTSELQLLCERASEQLVLDVELNLRSKGYEIVGPAPTACVGANSSPTTGDACSALDAVRVDIFETLPRQYSASIGGAGLTFRTNTTLPVLCYLSTPDSSRLEHNPFGYQTTSSLTNVLLGLGVTNSDAVLLVETKAFFESKRHGTKRALYNWTGGGLAVVGEVGFNTAMYSAMILSGHPSVPPDPFWVNPFWHSDNTIGLSIALVNVRTREVLWVNQQNFNHMDPRKPQAIAQTVTCTMRDLPRKRQMDYACSSQEKSGLRRSRSRRQFLTTNVENRKHHCAPYRLESRKSCWVRSYVSGVLALLVWRKHSLVAAR